MTTSFICPDCDRHSAFEDAAPGRALTCPGCGSAFQVDAANRQVQRIPGAAAAAEKTALNLFLGLLDDLETLGKRMIVGIGRFLAHALPTWLGRQLLSLGRITIKIARVLAVFAVWFVITFAPLTLAIELPGATALRLLAVAWTALALAGSFWGALYVRRRRPKLWNHSLAGSSHALMSEASENGLQPSGVADNRTS